MLKTKGRFSIRTFHVEHKLLRVAVRVASKSYALTQPLTERPDYGTGNDVSVPRGQSEEEVEQEDKD